MGLHIMLAHRESYKRRFMNLLNRRLLNHPVR
jgi:hypothetical protein